MNMICRLTLLFIVAAFLPLIAYGQASDHLRVGVSVPLSGPGAPYGTDIQKVLTFLNNQYFQNHFQFVFEDDKCDPKEGMGVANRLAEVEKVPVVVGMACSGVALATAPVYERNNVTVISFLATTPKYAGISPFHYRTRPSVTATAKVLADYAKLTYKSVAILAQETEYAQGAADALVSSMGDAVKLHRESVLPSTSDYRQSLLRLRTQNPESLILIVQFDSALIDMVKQTRQAGWNVPIMGIEFPGNTSFLSAAGKLADGVVFSTIPTPLDFYNNEGKALFSLCESQVGPLSQKHLFNLVARGMIALSGINSSTNLGPQSLSNRTFMEFGRPFSFDSSGEANGLEPVLKRIVGGTAQTIQ